MFYFLFVKSLFPLGPMLETILKWLLPISILILLALFVLSIIKLKQRAAWLWLIPVVFCMSAYGVDRLVQTDAESIKEVINKGKNAFKKGDMKILASVISEDYQDSFHSSKQQLLNHCSMYLNGPVFKSITTTSMQTEQKDNRAIVTLVVFITFENQGYVFENYGVTAAKVAVRINLKKERDNNWRILSCEIIEVDNQPFNWQQVR
jgi:hypothetical protein